MQMKILKIKQQKGEIRIWLGLEVFVEPINCKQKQKIRKQRDSKKKKLKRHQFSRAHILNELISLTLEL